MRFTFYYDDGDDFFEFCVDSLSEAFRFVIDVLPDGFGAGMDCLGCLFSGGVIGVGILLCVKDNSFYWTARVRDCSSERFHRITDIVFKRGDELDA